MLSETAKSSFQSHFIIVDEPENHLHPEAIRYIDSVLREISLQNQVLISTYNPIFINRSSISSNIIVDHGEARQADRIDTIRYCLGVICSDNLMYADYVIIVEGPTDRDVLMTLLSKDETLNNYLNNSVISIRNIGGTDNLSAEIYSLQRYCCNYLLVLDYDSAGKNAVNQAKNKYGITDDQVRYFMKENKKDTELEDLYNEDIYKDYLLSKQIDINNSLFKNKAKKWSDRINMICAQSGIDFTADMEAELKKILQI